MAFDKIKEFLSKPPVLMPLIQGNTVKLYSLAANESVGYHLAQNNS